MNTKGMIRSSWQRPRNSCGTNRHLQYNVLLAHGGCVPLGFCAMDPGRKLGIVLNPLCNGSASTNTSSVRYGSSILFSLVRPQQRLFSLDSTSGGTILFSFSFSKTSWIRLSIPYLHVFYGASRL